MLVGTKSKEEYNELVEEVLIRIEVNYLYMKPTKCKQKVKEVGFLEVVMGPDGIRIEEEKVKVVLNQPVPKIIKEVQKFLGLVNYYRQFIKDFAKIARLLHELNRKEQKWKQKIRQEKSFKALKKVFTTKLILVAPDLDKKMRIEIDTLDYVTGGVLLMKYADGRQRLVVYLSKSLNEIEQNYEIHDKEMLAVIRGLKAWRHLLESTKFKFEVWTDLKNLEYFMKTQKLNQIQARQTLYLSMFYFTLKHVPEMRMEKADRLNKRPDLKVRVENDNENQKLIKE